MKHKQQIMGTLRFWVPLLLFCLTFSGFATAQTVSGMVTDAATGEALIGASVIEVGTRNGTRTDSDGKFKLTVSSTSGTIEVSYVGYETARMSIGGASSLDVKLSSGSQLDEVVVTALGISREKKSLTYGAQEISNSDLTRVKDANVINSLSGRTAGLQINRSGSGVGGSTRVVMRGQKSTRDNNVLYVIDGVPMFNFSPGQPGDVWGQSGNSGNVGRDGGDAISNLNPEDIESMTVLKGASAAALYGSQAANGVILVTTKKGRAGDPKIEFSSNATWEQAALTPELQFSYGSRQNENFSWGEKGTSPDHVKDFFQTGATYINSIGLTGGNKSAQTYFSYANTTSKGIIPTSQLSRHNLTLRETAEFLNGRISLNATFNYTNQRGDNRGVQGMYFNPLTGLYLFPRGQRYADYSGDNFEKYDDVRKLYLQNWVGSRDDWQNPNWILNRNPNFDLRNRFYGTVGVGIKLTDWANLQFRGNMDKTYDGFEQHSYAGTEATLADENGRFVMSNLQSTVRYGDVLLNLRKDFSDISAALTLGSSINDVKVLSMYADSKGPGMYYANTFVIQNIRQPGANITQSQPNRSQLQSVFGSLSLGYKGMVYLDVTGRNDWSSTLAFTSSNSFFYPSVGASAILSEMFSMKGIDYAKVRASYAQVGNGVNPYDTNIQYSFPAGGAQAPSTGLLPGTDVQNELSKSLEIGADVRFWNNRAGIDLTWYKTNTTNQRIVVSVPQGSGLSTAIINAGDIQNSGIEATLSLTPVRTSKLEWNTQLNFTRNVNKVVELTPLLADGVYTLTDGGVNNYDMVIREGYAFGEIGGKGFKYLNGKVVVNADGVPLAGADTVLGNPAPDFTLGWNNTLRFGNFSVGVLIDGRFGGEVMSITQAVTDRFGVSKVTSDAREAGGVTVDAVREDGSAFTGKVDPEKYYVAVGGRDGITEAYIYDGTSIRLRELSIGYMFPKGTTSRISKGSSLRLSLVGRNLVYFVNKAPFDPDIAMSTGTGLQGVDVFSAPAVRSIGVNLGFTF
ncbi:MAG TPA: SusC/RagA family TonB-linked outer membrane protein [Saprospiraceae bacterium]|nr:SusC/RagA family TonB-linked outer membrane protein [Saprospiraceae bacterium]